MTNFRRSYAGTAKSPKQRSLTAAHLYMRKRRGELLMKWKIYFAQVSLVKTRPNRYQVAFNTRAFSRSRLAHRLRICLVVLRAVTLLAHMADQGWNPSPTLNVVDDMRS